MWSEAAPTPYQLELHREHQARRARMGPRLVVMPTRAEIVSAPRRQVGAPDHKCAHCRPPAVIVIGRDARVFPMGAIVDICAEFFAVKRAEIRSPRRTKTLCDARHCAMWLLRKYTTRSTTDIGRFLGDRDHTTVLHGVKRVDERLTRAEFAADFARLEARVRERIGGS